MDEDILAAERPIDHDYRQRLKSEILLLGKLAALWIDITHAILYPIDLYLEHWDDTEGPAPVPVVPLGYIELAHLLMFYSDTSQFNIDSAPIGDFIDALVALQDADWFTRDPDAFIHCDTAMRRARRTLNRICEAAYYAAGEDSPIEITEPKRRRGRPPGTYGPTRRSIIAAIEAGSSDDDIAFDHDREPEYVAKIRRKLERNNSPTQS